MYSFHYTVTIFSTLSNLSVNWTTSTKSLCVFAHRWQFIICYEQFPCYYSLEPQRERSIFISTSHPHVLVHTHPRWPLHTNENENRNSGKKVEPIWWGNENANLENVWNFLVLRYSLLSCRFNPTWFNIFLITALCEERGASPPSLHAQFNVWQDDISAGPGALSAVKE